MKRIIKMILIFIMAIGFFPIPCLQVLAPSINIIFKLINVFSFIILVILYIKNKKINPIIIYIVLFCFLLGFVTYYNGYLNINNVFNILNILSVSMFIDYYIKKDNDIINILLLYFEIIIIINLVTIIMYKDGMYVTTLQKYNYFLGYDNSHIVYFLTAFYLSYINNIVLKNNYKRFYILFSVISLSVLLRMSATSLMGYVFMVIFIVYNKKISKNKILNLKNYLICIICLFLFLIVFKAQEIFSFLIVDILNKDLTFTNRTIIWDATLKSILKHPIIGYGIEPSLVRVLKNNIIYGVNAHCFIYEVLYQTGLLGFSIFNIIVTKIIIFTSKYSNKILTVLSYSFFILLFMGLMEVYDFKFTFILLVLLSNFNYIKGVVINEKN